MQRIAAVAAANPHAVVFLRRGGSVLMPWVHSVGAGRGSVLGGTRVQRRWQTFCSRRCTHPQSLPITFPPRDGNLPHPQLVLSPSVSQEGWNNEAAMSRRTLARRPPFLLDMIERLQVGYRWYDQQQKPVLFLSGYGFTYGLLLIPLCACRVL